MATHVFLLSIDILMALVLLAFGALRGQFVRALNFVFFAATVVVCGMAIAYLIPVTAVMYVSLILGAGILVLSFIRLMQIGRRFTLGP